MKKFFVLLSVLLIIAYLSLALTAFNTEPTDQVCKKIELIIKDSVNAGFITPAEVSSLFKSKDVYPVGKKMEDIHTKTLEDLLRKHPLVEDAECYKTPGNTICVEVTQRLPILRVMSSKGENYYIDDKGKIIPNDESCIAHRVVATGNIEKSYAMKELYRFGVFLQKNKFWNAQIEQIHVTAAKEVELVPRVGDHIIFLGKLDNFEDKLESLKVFYEKALNQVGWNKYSRINMEFSNQIICTKKE